jgi:hypothetical protein
MRVENLEILDEEQNIIISEKRNFKVKLNVRGF